MSVRAAALLVALLAACAFAAPAARADGDPASDVLINSRTFHPYYVKLPPASTNALARSIAEAKGTGYAVRVALIAHDYDLGSAGLLFRKPEVYAKFLAQELAQFNRDWVLVVMPGGYGIYRCVPKKRPGGYADPCELGTPASADERLLAGLPSPGSDLAAAGDVAVRRLAELHGASSGGGVPPQLLAVAAVLAVLAGAALLLRRRRRTRA